MFVKWATLRRVAEGRKEKSAKFLTLHQLHETLHRGNVLMQSLPSSGGNLQYGGAYYSVAPAEKDLKGVYGSGEMPHCLHEHDVVYIALRSGLSQS